MTCTTVGLSDGKLEMVLSNIFIGTAISLTWIFLCAQYGDFKELTNVKINLNFVRDSMSNCACECTCTSIYIREDKREENGDCADGGEEADVNFNN